MSRRHVRRTPSTPTDPTPKCEVSVSIRTAHIPSRERQQEREHLLQRHLSVRRVVPHLMDDGVAGEPNATAVPFVLLELVEQVSEERSRGRSQLTGHITS